MNRARRRANAFAAMFVLVAIAIGAPDAARGAPPSATVNRVDWAITPGGARVSIQVGGGEVRWSGGRAAADPAAGLPERAFVDIRPAMLAPSLTRAPVVIDKGILKRMRVGQNDQETVRVAIEVSARVRVEIHGEKSPPRIVVDLRTDAEGGSREAPAGVPPPAKSPAGRASGGAAVASTSPAGPGLSVASPTPLVRALPTPTQALRTAATPPARMVATPTPTLPAWALATPTPTPPVVALATPTPTLPAWALATPTP
ncbi:MAG: AMIN domain-containing protein, partial [Alphaproteobacteria bacterium]